MPSQANKVGERVLFARKFNLCQNAYIHGHTSTMICETLEFAGLANKLIIFLIRPAGQDLEGFCGIFFQKLHKMPSRLKRLIYAEF